jgi:hypothetical protein
MKVRFMSGWFAPSETFIPSGDRGKVNDQGKPMRSFSGKFFKKFNHNDPRTVYDLPDEMLAVLPRTAKVMKDDEVKAVWTNADELRKPTPYNLHEAVREVTEESHMVRVAEIEAEAEETLKKRQAAAAKAREAKANKAKLKKEQAASK